MLGLIGAGMSAVGGLTGIINGFSQKAEGKRMQREAAQKIEDFQWQDLTNPYSNLGISTAGSEFARDEAARMSATGVQGLRSAGARGILGGLGAVTQANNKVAREQAIDLDRQQRAIDMSAAQDETRIRAMREQRQADELAGYGAMMNMGMGMKNMGMANIAGGLSATGQSLGNIGGIPGGMPKSNSQRPQLQTVSAMQSQGLNYMDATPKVFPVNYLQPQGLSMGGQITSPFN